MTLTCRAALTLAVLLASTSVVRAASPEGQWTATFYSGPNLAATATQGVCFQGNQTWYSTTAHWRGSWAQAGDRLRWYGPAPTTTTATFGQFVGAGQIAGEFAEFYLADGSTFNVGNWSLRYKGSTCSPPATRGAVPAKVGVTK